MMGAPQLLHDLLDRAAQHSPDNAALTYLDTTLTYRDLAAASCRMARRLHDEGLGFGDRILVQSANGLVIPLVVYAAARLGAAFSVLHEEVRGRPLEHVLQDCVPTLLISDVTDAAQVGTRYRVGFLSAAELLNSALDVNKEHTVPEPPAAGPITVDPVCLIYTSGTTDLPKAVVSTHQQVLFSTTAIQACLNYRDSDIIYCPLPLSFDYALYQLFLAPVNAAHVQLGTAGEAGPLLLRRLQETEATVLPAVPSIAEKLAWLLRRSSGNLPRLRLLTNTGAALSDSTMAALRHSLPQLSIQVMYGLTECKRATIMPPDGDLERPGSCGLPLPGTDVFVMDDDSRRLPAGQIGQLVVRGLNVMAGYWRRSELTEQRFYKREGLFPELRTGDYGWRDDDGYIYFVGRRDDIYKERGFRLSTIEVEAAAHRVEGVISAAVLPPEGERLATLAVVADISEQEVLRRMREQIEMFKIPRRCVRFDELPANSNGKVDHSRLASLIETSMSV